MLHGFESDSCVRSFGSPYGGRLPSPLSRSFPIPFSSDDAVSSQECTSSSTLKEPGLIVSRVDRKGWSTRFISKKVITIGVGAKGVVGQEVSD